MRREFRLPFVVDLGRTLAPTLRRPTGVVRPDGVWRATRTPDGPATIRLWATGTDLHVTAWGPGSAWAIEQAPASVGALDDTDGFDPSAHPLVSRLWQTAPGTRIARTAAVFESLVIAVLEQKVQSGQARRAFRSLVARYGEPAPGPVGRWLRLPPEPSVLARVPAYAFHSMNVEAKRATTIVSAARYASRIDGVLHASELCVLPGIGVWTAAEVGAAALGDADAVSLGDYHLPNTVAWALAGEPRADDERLVELLEPWRGHRARVVRLIETSGVRAPRYGPRLALQDIRSY